jgi:peroxiredoxin Q/BCP
MLKIGDKAPEFRLKTDEGGELSLSDFRGKRVVLFFFPRANTPG